MDGVRTLVEKTLSRLFCPKVKLLTRKRSIGIFRRPRPPDHANAPRPPSRRNAPHPPETTSQARRPRARKATSTPTRPPPATPSARTPHPPEHSAFNRPLDPRPHAETCRGGEREVTGPPGRFRRGTVVSHRMARRFGRSLQRHLRSVSGLG
ncbi:hypothetical protein GCM10022214_41040 [Actinomadura miaoliensis]|uniref:Uncharacterized protein n=1 Tax=Actinomadura miaoliensis TaxID=430685 RepID=A0ABP7W104_9ACTN